MRFLIFVLVLTALLATSFGMSEEEQAFKSFMKTYGKEYRTQVEYDYRFQVFVKNYYAMKEKDARDSQASWGVTKFSDLTSEEFRSRYLLKNFESPKTRGEKLEFVDLPPAPYTFPTEYDWRNHTPSVLTPVYNQGQCGSCWAFSITENIESMWALANNTLVSLSMQQVVDCDRTDDGCGGGNPPTAYQYVISAGGLELFKDYPYVGINTRCSFDKSDIAASIKSWKYITQRDDEQAMQQFVYTTGPPSICVDASSWSGYMGGVIGPAECGHAIDHCVQLIGWKVVNGKNAWIVRNSWGKDWGPYGGFLYVEMGHDTCAIGQEVTTSVV